MVHQYPKYAHCWRSATKIFNFYCFFRPDAVSLVDAFDINDITLSSDIGAYDGHAYQRLYQAAQHSPLNQSEVC